MNTKLLKIVLLPVLFFAAGHLALAQDNTVSKEKTQDKKNHTSTTIVLKVIKDENGQVTTIDTTFTSDEVPDSADMSISSQLDIDENGLITLSEEMNNMMKNIHLDSLQNLTKHFKINIGTDFDIPEDFEIPEFPEQPGSYSYQYNWNGNPFLNQGALQQLLWQNLQNGNVKIKTRKNGKKIIIKIDRNNDIAFVIPPVPPMPPAPPSLPKPSKPSKLNKKSKVIIIEKDGKTKEL